MTQHNDRYSDRMGLSAREKSSQEIDDLIEDTERSIANTRSFLERIQLTETENQRYVEQICNTFEGSLKNLKRRRERSSEEPVVQEERVEK